MSTGKIAVVLNPRAKRVSSGKIRRFQRYDSDHVAVFLSESFERVEEIAKRIFDENYDVVQTCGGDGTIYRLWNAMHNLRSRDPNDFPVFDLQKLGTGNSLTNLVNNESISPWKRLEKLLAQPDLKHLPVREIPLIEITVKSVDKEQSQPLYYVFAGAGLDALIALHYHEFKAEHPWSEGVLGYLLAIASKTIPDQLRRDPFHGATITCPSGKLYRIGEHDRMDIEKVDIKPGEKILPDIHASVNSMVVGTAPFYGFSFRAFPFSNFGHYFNNGVMQVRILHGAARSFIPEMLLHSVGLWRGTYNPSKIIDLFTDEIAWEYWGSQEDCPFQIAGDVLGRQHSIHCKLSPYKLRLVDNRKLLQRT